MRRLLLLAGVLIVSCQQLPDEIYVEGGDFHVQGIAYDNRENCLYCSFTSALFKAGTDGEVTASAVGINGHLGAMCFDPVDRKIYASLEYKDDEIGRGISSVLDEESYSRSQTSFNIAVFDAGRLSAKDIPADEVMTLYRVDDAVDDYMASVSVADTTLEHRYACSGIDGIAIAPAAGDSTLSSRRLYVAYGIYGDVSRSDNDYNVLLCYDLKDLSRPLHKYFVYTGNTTWGVQNLAYDRSSGKLLMAVYRGRKEQFPNYSLYSIDIARAPFRGALAGVPYQDAEVEQLSLSSDGIRDDATGICGWNFKWGATGMCPVGHDRWYVSEQGKTDGVNWCRACLYEWTGEDDGPFLRAASAEKP